MSSATAATMAASRRRISWMAWSALAASYWAPVAPDLSPGGWLRHSWLSTMSGASAGDVVEQARRLLRELPLCDNCLGRMFALLGRGLTNAERGRAIKTAVLMELHAAIREGSEEAREELRRLGPRLGEVARTLYTELFGEWPGEERCAICGGGLAPGIEEAAARAVELLRTLDVETFLVAARIPPETRLREEEIKASYGLTYSESIGAEVRREVSKRIQRSLSLRPDFNTPHVLVEVDVGSWSVSVQRLPFLLRGRYWKLGRRVSQTIWITRLGERRYPYSVEDALAWLAEAYEGTDAVLHAAGREDADVRMLGTGRPFIVEVKEPARRTLSLKAAEVEVNRRAAGLVRVRLEGPAKRRDVARVKGEDGRHSKVYKALVKVSRMMSDDELKRLEEFFHNREVRQRTPRRVRHRRPDVVRERVVFSVATRRLGRSVFEALIHAEGGLYIKELISGDGGDTRPSFAEVLGAEAYCAELDVVAVIPAGAERL